jgi:hypothetical protein
MFRICLLASLGFALLTAAPASAACSGPDPAITSVAVKSVSQSNGMNNYTLVGTVTNNGGQAQSKDTLQFVDISQTPGEKLDAKGIPPLRPGESYTFSYVMQRATESGKGTTTLRFQLDMRQPPGTAGNCETGNDTQTVTF